jgi:predicted peroxiredoxin
MMGGENVEFTEECLDVFLEKQGQLFDEEVAGSREEAEAFLEDCMAQVVPNIKQVRRYLDESGMDVEGMTDEELADQSEIFPLPDGSFLIVEG